MALVRVLGLVSVLAAATAAPSGTDDVAAQKPSGRDVRRCEALTRFRMAGLEITSARVVPVTPPNTVQPSPFSPAKIGVALPQHCRVEGVLDRRKGADNVDYGVGFALVLPDNWNGRFLYQGGGGLNGSIGEPLGVTAAGAVPALARGFAIISTDSGHKGAVFDNAFMKDQQAALDFAYDSVGKVTETGRYITTEYYDRAPEHIYSVGCSTGGREGMLAAQSYPLLFDGVIAGAPAMRTGYSNIALTNAAVAFNQIAPRDAQKRPIPAQAFSLDDRKLLANAVLAQCDALDGLKDGLIYNLHACHFDPAVLQCKSKTKKAECLSAGQVKALRTAFGGPHDSRGHDVYTRYPYDPGEFGTSGVGLAFLPMPGPSPLGPPNLSLAFDVDEAVDNVRADDLQNMTDTSAWTNLSTFYGRGGRIMFFHGASDPWFSNFDTETYEAKLRLANPGVDGSRFYSVPGMSHCGGGGLDDFDMLTALVDWVEKRVAPTSIVSTGRAFPGRSRPLCPAPLHAHYKGNGDPEDAASFECRVS